MKASEVRKEMVDALKESIAIVTFTKKDGTERVMKATLMPNSLPKDVREDKPKAVKKINEEVVAVFDIEANGFRSFRVDSVISFFSPRVAMENVQGLFN